MLLRKVSANGLQAAFLWFVLFAAFSCTETTDPVTNENPTDPPPTTPPPEDPPATVEVLLPGDGSTVIAPRLVAVRGGEVDQVQFEVDGTTIFEDVLGPFEWTLDPRSHDEGEHDISVVITHASGAEETVKVRVTFAPAPQGADQPPEVFDAVENLAPGEWYEIPNTHLADVKPPADWSGVPSEPGGSILNIMSSWSGGAYDTKRDRLIVHGGGHTGYAGNEVYAFDMATLKWLRLTDPTPLDPDDPSNSARNSTWPDGRPVAVHTAGYMEYLPEPIDKLMIAGTWGEWKSGTTSSSVHGNSDTFYFDFDDLEWEIASTDNPGYDECPMTAVAADGRVWFKGGGGKPMSVFDPVNRTWTHYQTRSSWMSSGYATAIDPKHNRFLAIGTGHGSSAGYLYAFDLDHPNDERVALSTKGDREVEDTYAPGFIYHPPSGQMVAWKGGAAVYTLDVDTLEWTKHPTTGSVSPGQPQETGTWNRFSYVPSKKLFVLVNESVKNVFVYRLPNLD